MIWFIFFVLFLSLGIFHLWQMNNKISLIDENTERKFNESGSVYILGTNVDKPLQDKIIDINNFISELNKSNKNQNFASAIGYLLASLTALCSIFFSSEQINKLKNSHNGYCNKYLFLFRKWKNQQKNKATNISENSNSS